MSLRRIFSMKCSFNPFSNLNFLHILNDGYLASIPLLLPFIQKDLKIEFSKIGLLTSLLNIAGVILAIPAATISMRFGGYKVIITSIFFYCSAFFITGISTNYMVLVFAFILASLGFGMFHPISFALIANTSDTKNIGKNMGAFTAVGDIGRIGIAAFVTVLVSFVNWRNTSFLYGVFPVILFIISLVFCQKLNLDVITTSKKKGSYHGLHNCSEYIVVIITSFIDGLASSSLFVFIPFLYISKGASTALLGSLTGAFFVGNMLGKVVIGKITDLFGCKIVFIISEVIMALLLILLTTINNIYIIILVSILLGTVTKGTVPVINSLLAKSVPNKNLNEKAFGIVALFSGIASVIAPVLYGFVAQQKNITTVFQLSAFFAMIAIVPIILHTLIHSRKKAM